MCRLWVGGTLQRLPTLPMRQGSRLQHEDFPRILAYMAMVINIPKTFVLVFNLAFPEPYHWTINWQPYRLCLR